MTQRKGDTPKKKRVQENNLDRLPHQHAAELGAESLIGKLHTHRAELAPIAHDFLVEKRSASIF